MPLATPPREIEVDAAKGEASALLPCTRPEILDRYDFERAFWVALDEGPVECSIALLGHKRGRELGRKWKLKHLDLAPPKEQAGRTEDAESLARHGDWIWVLGSQFGAKSGPLEPKRAFVARFREDAIDGKLGKARLPLEVARRPFAIHRAVNDALARSGIELIPLGSHVRRTFIEDTLRRGHENKKRWAPDVRVEDWPINLEGAVFDRDGSLIAGLRFPVSAGGNPLLVRLHGVESLFGDSPGLSADLVGSLAAVGDRGRATGVRALQELDGALHLITGPIGSVDKSNSVSMDYPGSERAACEHWRLAPTRAGRQTLRGERLVRFATQRVEGLAPAPDGNWHYVVDEEGTVRVLVRQIDAA